MKEHSSTRIYKACHNNNLFKQIRVWLLRKWNSERYHPKLIGLIINPNYITRVRLRRFVASCRGDYNNILDFGGGESPYRTIFSSPNYVNIEYSLALQSDGISARHSDARVSATDIFYDGKSIPLPNCAIDLVLATEVFEHVFNLGDVLDEIHRILRPGGRLLLTAPFMIHEHERPHDFGRYTIFGMQHVLSSHGFDVLRSDRLGSRYHIILQHLIWGAYGLVKEGSGLIRWASVPALLAIPVLNLLSLLPLGQNPVRSGAYLNIAMMAERRIDSNS